ncbi:MAG: 2-dehydropantoate 2-reductase [Rhodospirillaceae bacterium]|nr:2-dehydropantoate 2-reductase [Rhodospirillaceae bacterium]
MKIAVFGTGGVGGDFGARLAAAGEEVHFIARGRHLEAIRKDGLRIESPLGDAHVEKARATDDPAAVGHADMVMVAVKLYDTDEAVRACRPLVGPDSTVASFQNGVTGGDALTAAFGPQRVIGGTAAIAAMISAPGVITHTGAIATIAFGEWDGIASPRAEALLGAFENAGVEATLAGDVTAAIWSKFVFLSSFSGITCALRLPIGPIREDPDHWSLFRRAMEETFAVAGARGVALAGDLVDQRLAFTEGFAPETYASMYHDLMAGKRIELPWLSGAVADMGRELGVATPVHEGFRQTLEPFVDGGAGGKAAGRG